MTPHYIETTPFSPPSPDNTAINCEDCKKVGQWSNGVEISVGV